MLFSIIDPNANNTVCFCSFIFPVALLVFITIGLHLRKQVCLKLTSDTRRTISEYLAQVYIKMFFQV